MTSLVNQQLTSGLSVLRVEYAGVLLFGIIDREVEVESNKVSARLPSYVRDAICLAETLSDRTWALYAFRVEPTLLPSGVDEDDDWVDEWLLKATSAVTPELQGLLASGLSYPPALALLADRVERDRNVSRGNFCSVAAAILTELFQASMETPYFLALMVDPRTVERGQYYWIVSYDSATDQVDYVEDFATWTRPRNAFQIPIERCQLLLRSRS